MTWPIAHVKCHKSKWIHIDQLNFSNQDLLLNFSRQLILLSFEMANSTNFSDVSDQKIYFEFQQDTFSPENSNMYEWYLTKVIREKTIINEQILIFVDQMLTYYESWKNDCDFVFHAQMKDDIEKIIVIQRNFVKSIRWKNICHFFFIREIWFSDNFKKTFVELMHEIFNNDYYENWTMNQIKYVEKNFDNIFRIIRWRKNELLNQFDAFVAFAAFAENWFVKLAFIAFATDFATINQNTTTFEILSTVNFSKQIIENSSTFIRRSISVRRKKQISTFSRFRNSRYFSFERHETFSQKMPSGFKMREDMRIHMMKIKIHDDRNLCRLTRLNR